MILQFLPFRLKLMTLIPLCPKSIALDLTLSRKRRRHFFNLFSRIVAKLFCLLFTHDPLNLETAKRLIFSILFKQGAQRGVYTSFVNFIGNLILNKHITLVVLATLVQMIRRLRIIRLLNLFINVKNVERRFSAILQRTGSLHFLMQHLLGRIYRLQFFLIFKGSILQIY